MQRSAATTKCRLISAGKPCAAGAREHTPRGRVRRHRGVGDVLLVDKPAATRTDTIMDGARGATRLFTCMYEERLGWHEHEVASTYVRHVPWPQCWLRRHLSSLDVERKQYQNANAKQKMSVSRFKVTVVLFLGAVVQIRVKPWAAHSRPLAPKNVRAANELEKARTSSR